MNNNHQPPKPNKVIRGELIDDSSRAAPKQSLAAMSQQIRFSTGLGTLLQPKDLREITKRFKAARLTEVVDLAVERLHKETDGRIVEIELAAEQCRSAILAAQNQRMGDLKQRQMHLTGKAMRDEIQTEQLDQRELERCDMLDDDREMLAQLYKHRTAKNISRIACEHGLRNLQATADVHREDEEKET